MLLPAEDPSKPFDDTALPLRPIRICSFDALRRYQIEGIADTFDSHAFPEIAERA
jgi:hypothetical protein